MMKRARVLMSLSATLFWAGGEAVAERISIKGNNPNQLKAKCNAGGGTYWPPTAQGVYGCVGKTGNTVVCGGVRKGDKNTCDIIMMAPGGPLPTREQITPDGGVLSK